MMEDCGCGVVKLRAEHAALAARLVDANRLIVRLPCRCVNMGDGDYIECDRCLFLHGPADSAAAGEPWQFPTHKEQV
jgi:hypothetical protein